MDSASTFGLAALVAQFVRLGSVLISKDTKIYGPQVA